MRLTPIDTSSLPPAVVRHSSMTTPGQPVRAATSASGSASARSIPTRVVNLTSTPGSSPSARRRTTLAQTMLSAPARCHTRVTPRVPGVTADHAVDRFVGHLDVIGSQAVVRELPTASLAGTRFSASVYPGLRRVEYLEQDRGRRRPELVDLVEPE